MGAVFNFFAGVVETVVGVVTGNIGLIVTGVSTIVGGFMGSPEKQAAPGAVSGISEQIALDPSYPRRLLVGTASTAGSLIDVFTHDHLPWGGGNEGKNRVKEMIVALADHECDSLVEIWDGTRKLTLGTYDSTLGWPIMEFTDEGKNHCYIKFYNGSWTQAADAHCISVSGGYWTSAHRGAGVCYVRITMAYTIDQDDKAWNAGQPQFKFVVKGRKLYDPRKDSTVGGAGTHRFDDLTTHEWSDNAAQINYNLIRGMYLPNGELFYGVGASDAQVRFSDAVAAMNACDEDVALKAGGTEKRYRAGGEIDTSVEVRTTLQAINESMAGSIYNVSGVWRIFAGVAQSAIVGIADGDILPKEGSSASPKLAYDALVNAVYGTYIDPKTGYSRKPLPVRRNSSDIAEDGGWEKSTNLQLDFVQSFTQGQRLQEIKRRRARRQIRHTRTLPPYAYVIEPGDWISWDSDRFGYTGKNFLVSTASIQQRLKITLTLEEIDSTVYDWTAASDELSETGGEVLTADPPVTLIPANVTAVPSLQVGPSGTQVPIVTINWDAPNVGLVTGVAVQVRRNGTTAPVTTITATDVQDANTALRMMLMPDVLYEARVKFLTPAGVDTAWSGWITFTPSDGFIFTPGADPITSQLQRALADAKPIRDAIAQSMYFPWLDQLELAIAAATQVIADHQNTVGILHDAGIVRGADGSVRISQVDQLALAIGDVSASVTVVQSVQADLQDRTTAFWQVTAAADGTVAYARLQADNVTSSIVLVADLISLVSPSDGSLVPALSVTNGNVYVSNQIFIGTNLRMDRTVPGLVYDDGTVAAVFGARFGALGDLVIWYGPSMPTSAMRKSNGVFWLDTFGNAYFGGALSAGVSTTKAKTTSTATDAVAETAVFTYNGHTLTISTTYDGFNNFTAGPFDTQADMNAYCDTIGVSHGLGTDGGASGPIVVKLYRSENGGAYVEKQSYSCATAWSADKYRDTETLKYFVQWSEVAATISQTWTDDDGTPDLRQYKFEIATFASKFGAMASGQTLSVICVEEET